MSWFEIMCACMYSFCWNLKDITIFVYGNYLMARSLKREMTRLTLCSSAFISKHHHLCCLSPLLPENTFYWELSRLWVWGNQLFMGIWPEISSIEPNQLFFTLHLTGSGVGWNGFVVQKWFAWWTYHRCQILKNNNITEVHWVTSILFRRDFCTGSNPNSLRINCLHGQIYSELKWKIKLLLLNP